MNKMNMLKVACATALFLSVQQTPALANVIKLGAQLTGAAETPPVTTTGSATFEGLYDTKTKRLSWTITYSELSGPITRIDLHGQAAHGSHGAIKLKIPSGESPINGTALLTKPSQRPLDEALLKGHFYVNIHTKAHPHGEVRGQIKTEH